MDCPATRPLLLDYHRGRLAAALHEEVHIHLEGCAACAHEEVAERALTDVLERLPQHGAPVGLKRRLALSWPAPQPGAPARRRAGWRRAWLPALAAAVVLAVALPRLVEQPTGRVDAGHALAVEAVNDHLRVLERGLSVPGGGIHQVKPWFAGRLDFAPIVTFAGDVEYPLEGGAVERFLDRQAAVFAYGRRLHRISLLVFRAEGLPWPTPADSPSGRPAATPATVRGFNVLVWRSGELGYALVSDVDARDLAELARRLGG
jgi:anti-sigma factor RsiW